MRLIIFLLMFFLAIINVHAQDLIEISSYRDNFAAGETVQFDLKFNGELDNDLQYSNLRLSNIYNINFDTSFTIEKINDFRYYIYFNLPSNLVNDTYKFSVKDLDIYDGEDFVRINREAYFSITKSNYSLSIYPGIFLLNNDISLVNIKNNLDNNLYVEFSGEGILLEYDNLYLNGRISKDIQFRKEGNISYSEIRVSYGDKFYLVPVHFIYDDFVSQEQNLTNFTISKKSVVFAESSKIINKTLYTNESLSAPIRFYNNGNTDLSNIQIDVSNSLNGVLKVNQSSFSSLKKGEFKSFLVEINKNSLGRQEQFEGAIKLKSGEVYDTIYVYLYFKKPPEVRTFDKDNVTKITNVTNKTVIIEPRQDTNNRKLTFVLVITILTIVVFISYIFLKKKIKPKIRGKNYSYYLRR